MTLFSYEYGFNLLIESFNFVMKHKRLFLYMFLANLVAAVIMYSFIGSEGTIFELSANTILLYFSLCEGLSALFMVPLIYAVIYLKSEKEKTDMFMIRIIWHHVGPIIGYVVLTVVTGLGVRFGLDCLGYIAPSGNMYGLILIFGSTIFFLFILGIVALFLLSLLYYFVLVAAVVKKVGFVEALKESFIAVKHTLYSIIGGALCWHIIAWLFYFIFGFLLFSLMVHLVYMPLFLISVITLLINLIFYTLYYTVYVTFQTLLYLKYKEVTAAQNGVLVNEQ